MIRLTDEEIVKAINTDTHMQDTPYISDRYIAKAQLKKALQEVEDYITRDLEWTNEENEMLWKNKLKIWRQALLKEAQ